MRTIVYNKSEKAPTAVLNIAPCLIEITGVPRVGHIAGVVGILHKQMHFLPIIASTNALHVEQVRLIHSDQQVVPVVVCIGELSCSFAGTIYSMLVQLSADWRIY